MFVTLITYPESGSCPFPACNIRHAQPMLAWQAADVGGLAAFVSRISAKWG